MGHFFPSERQIRAKRAQITKITKRPHSSKRVPVAPCLVLKGDNLFEIQFTEAGKPTAASERLLDVMGCVPIKKAEPAVSSARADLEMMLKGA